MLRDTEHFDTDSSIVRKGLWRLHNGNSKFDTIRITLPSREARIVLAALVILVCITANRSWRIVSFWIHKVLSSTTNEPSLKTRKRQVVLRNYETAGGALLALLSLSRPHKPKLSSIAGLGIILLAFIHFVGFILLAFSTTKVDRGNLVVSRTTENCGFYLPALFENPETAEEGTSTFFRQWLVNGTLDAESYAQDCYKGKGQMGRTCDRMFRHALPYHTTTEVCPFSDKACTDKGNGSAFALDTGRISLAALGLNTKSAQKLSFRRREVCAPIRSGNFRYGEDDLKELIIELQADPSHAGLFLEDSTDTIRAFSHNLESLQPRRNNSVLYFKNNFSRFYNTHVTRAENASYASSLLQPEEKEMSVTVITVEMGTEIGFPFQLWDPLFNATRKIESMVHNKTTTRWQRQRDENFRSVACQESTQLCSLITGKCTPMTGINGLKHTEKWDLLVTLFGDGADATLTDAKAALLVEALLNSHIGEALKYRGGAGLQVSRHLVNGNQLQIGNEPWKDELKHMFEVFLARLQRGVLQSVKVSSEEGRGAKETRKGLADAGYDTLNGFCDHVLFHSDEHRSLSMDWIRLILVVCILVILASFTDSLLSLLIRLPFIPKFFRRHIANFLEQWRLDSSMSLVEAPGDASSIKSDSGLRKTRSGGDYAEIEEVDLGLISEETAKVCTSLKLSASAILTVHQKSSRPGWLSKLSHTASTSSKTKIPRKPVTSLTFSQETQYMRVQEGRLAPAE